ncbi:hypothetical protein BLNAU_10685 [Blattamonas nauphoetae]|uniref:Uncharacterized protein n=1 Tax=Blattamonas nauphoetae TaxID=2049346 RepID=A0ABQ9XPM9_9EUKA|nr:hypothetical protein BLNAU_10685 [Blattamonas nauphoetae]
MQYRRILQRATANQDEEREETNEETEGAADNLQKRVRVREGKRKRSEEEMMTRQKEGGRRADGEEQVAVGEQIPG